MKKKEKILIVILLILLVVVGSIYINVKFTKKGAVIQKQEINKGQLSETEGENAYVSTPSHLAEVNAQNQELSDLNIQISNTTVTADRLLKGYTAYKNGNIITGTMEDRGALNWAPTSSTTFTVPAGYYSGGTLNSAGAYNAGVTAADNRANANSTNYKTGYNAGYSAGVTAGKSNFSVITTGEFNYGNTYQTQNTTSYTATQDCYVFVAVSAHGNNVNTSSSGGTVLVTRTAQNNNGGEYSKWHQTRAYLHKLTKGQTITMTATGTYSGGSTINYIVIAQ